jgi:hypothetical protein
MMPRTSGDSRPPHGRHAAIIPPARAYRQRASVVDPVRFCQRFRQAK